MDVNLKSRRKKGGIRMLVLRCVDDMADSGEAQGLPQFGRCYLRRVRPDMAMERWALREM